MGSGGSDLRTHRTFLRIDADDADASEAEAAILRLAALAVKRPFPPALLPRLAAATQAVRAAVGATATERVQSVVALAGAVNTLTGALGVAPEPAARLYAATLLPPVGSIPWGAFDDVDEGAAGRWVGGDAPPGASVARGRHSFPPQRHARGRGRPAGGASLAGTPSRSAVLGGGGVGGSSGSGDEDGGHTDGGYPAKPPSHRSRAGAHLDNLAGLLRTVPAAAAGLDAQAQLYAGIPTTIAPLYAWVHARLGAASGRFLLRPADIEVARAFCFALRENVLIDDLPAAPRGAAAAAAAAAVAAATTPGGARRRPGGGAGGDGGVGAGGVGALRSPDASQWNVADRLRLVAAFAAATRSAGLAAGAHAAAARCGAWPSVATAAADLAAFCAAPDTSADAGGSAAAAPAAVASPTTDGIGGVDDGGGGGSRGGGGGGCGGGGRGGGGGGGDEPTAALAAARRMVRACATGVEGLRGAAVADATAMMTRRAVVEVVSLVSTAELWRRLELLFGEGWAPVIPPSGGRSKRAVAAAAAAAVPV